LIGLEQAGAPGLEVSGDGAVGGFAEGDDAFLSAFAHDLDDAERREEIAGEDIGGLGSAESAGVHEFEERGVAEVHARLGVGSGAFDGGVDESLHLCRGEDAWEFAPSCGAFEDVGGVGSEARGCFEEAEEHTDAGEVACDGGGFEAAFGLEVSEVSDEVVGRGVLGPGDAHIGEFVIE